MTLWIRMRWLLACLGLASALALPLAGWAQADDDSKADDETSVSDDAGGGSDDADEADEAEPAKPAKPEPEQKSAHKKTTKEKQEQEAETGNIDWTITHHGLYLAAEGSYNFLTSKSDIESSAKDAGQLTGNVTSNTDDSWGYGGRLGWRIMDRLGIEGQFAMLNDIEIEQRIQGDGHTSAKAQFLTATANAKGYLLTERFQPYGLFGAGYGYSMIDPNGQTRDRSHGFVMRFGLGADYYFTDQLGATSEVAYVLPTGDIDDFDYVGIHFGFFLRFYGE